MSPFSGLVGWPGCASKQTETISIILYFILLPLVASLLLVAMPFVPSSLLLLVVRPGALVASLLPSIVQVHSPAVPLHKISDDVV